MQQYLTKAKTLEGKYAYAKENANVQGKIRARAVWGTANRELQRENCKGGRVLMTIDGNNQT